jgi:hypothetical protein
MAGSLQLPATAGVRENACAEAAAIPWFVWCSALAVTSAMVGAHWDISWHRSIGRDTFWTPAHMAIYLGGVLAGISCGYLILDTTLRAASTLRDSAVSIWGFRGPLGAFIAAWGGIAMIVSAPWDNWWHSAYGLDVKVLSPPHVLLIAGILAVELGALILILGRMNRASGIAREKLNALFLYVGAMILVCLMVLVLEYIFRIYMHSGFFYRILAMAVPGLLAGLARASGRRWAATTVTGIYSLFILGCLWILPLFPAEPKLGPVYQQVTHFIPPEFPLLLIFPALALDTLWAHTQRWNVWRRAIVSSVVFVAVLVAVQWPFASFLMSPGSRNWVFGTMYFDYGLPPTSSYVRHIFHPLEATAAGFWTEMAAALAIAALTVRIGLAWGDWMRRIRR